MGEELVRAEIGKVDNPIKLGGGHDSSRAESGDGTDGCVAVDTGCASMKGERLGDVDLQGLPGRLGEGLGRDTGVNGEAVSFVVVIEHDRSSLQKLKSIR